MKNLKEIEESGFRYGDVGQYTFGSAFISLRIAIRSWFCTYSPERYPGYKVTWKEGRESASQVESSEYSELAVQTIIHAHHFCELIIKDILRRKHPLLADATNNQDVVLFRLLMGEGLSDEDSSTLNSIGFSEAKKRLMNLSKENLFCDEDAAQVLSANSKLLDTLNNLRNRMMHRGLYVLKREALDHLMAEYFLPMVVELTQCESYKGLEAHWKYSSLFCELDPIGSLIDEFKSGSQAAVKVSFLKELGRAAYFSPMHVPLKERETSIFKGQVGQYLDDRNLYDWMNGRSKLKQCPVCGLNSIELEIEHDDCEDDEKGLKINEMWVSDVLCKCCGFHVNESIGNPEDFKMNGFDRWFWKESHSSKLEQF